MIRPCNPLDTSLHHVRVKPSPGLTSDVVIEEPRHAVCTHHKLPVHHAELNHMLRPGTAAKQLEQDMFDPPRATSAQAHATLHKVP